MTPRKASLEAEPDDTTTRNAVVLCGRLAGVPEDRTLPSGDSIVTTRVIVQREPQGPGGSGATRSKQRVDTIDCVAWTARVQRTIRRWQPGDRVYVEGAIRRRFYTASHGTVSRVEVEVTRARRIRTADRSLAAQP